MALADEILALLASRAGQPVDYVALFMLLNTVAGGHYEERHSEREIIATLGDLLNSGIIQAWQDNCRLEPPIAIIPGQTGCIFRLSSPQ